MLPGVVRAAAAQPGAGPAVDPVDAIVARAGRAIEGNRPWQATVALAPVLRDPIGRTPAVRLLAARAAQAWEGWAEVIRLLEGAPWLDREAHGEGRALLARAYLERTELEPALGHARRAVRAAPDDSSRGERRLTLARVHDRAGRHDSAAAHYHAAARALPAVAEWLRLREAGLLADSASRARLYAEVNEPVAVARIPWTEALALERTGDRLAAARRYDALGARLAAVRLRLTAGDSAVRAAARRELADLLAPGLSAADAVDAIALFDREFPSRAPAEELRIARRAAAANLLERAAQGFARAGRGRLTDRDRLTYAGVLARLGRHQEALPLFEAVEAPDLRGAAAYQRARSILRSGQVDAALRALGQVAADHAGDAEAGSVALFLMGDLITDRGRDDSARAVFAQAFARYPASRFGRRSGFQAALITWLDGEYGAAAREFDSLAAGPAGGEETMAGLYWAGRALERAGDTGAARQRFREVLARGTDPYYAALASRRLGAAPPAFPADRGGAPEPATPPGLGRAALLRRLGLRVEAGFELAAFGQGVSPDRLRGAARELARAGEHGRAVRLAQRARDRGAALDRELAELLYPLPFRETLTLEAQRARLDPLLVAALIRQESLFDPEARSVADARGLMQVLPAVGAAYAARAGIAEFDPVLLYQPDLNLDFGVTHLAEALERFGVPEQALAAYNAGGHRVDLWLGMRGVREDPEVFVERIPFAETREYVRKVLGNHWMYQALHAPGIP